MREVNFALIGTRFMGKAHSNAYRQVRRFFPGKLTPRMKVLCGRKPGPELEETARLYGWEETATDWRQVVERKDIDVVDISTPGDTHHPIAIAAARARKHVICEKPLANSLAEALEMLSEVEKAGVMHMVNFNYRRVPAIALARQMVLDNRIGDVYHYSGSYFQDWIMNPDFPLVWRLQKPIAGSGALGDIGSHATDIALWLNGQIESVAGQMTTFIKERPVVARMEGGFRAIGGSRKAAVTVDDDANFLARFRNGSAGVFQLSRFAGGRRNCGAFEIYGSKGSLAYNLERMHELEFYDRTNDRGEQGFKKIIVSEDLHPYGGPWWPPGHFIGYEHTFIHAIHDFLASLEFGCLPEPSFREGVQTQAVLEAVERSAGSGVWQKVPN